MPRHDSRKATGESRICGLLVATQSRQHMAGLEKGPSRAHSRAMYYDCSCGLIFSIVPREIPLSEPEAAYCENCGLEIKGPRCTRYAEYIPVNKAIDPLDG
jgi:hypothetical protein